MSRDSLLVSSPEQVQGFSPEKIYKKLKSALEEILQYTEETASNYIAEKILKEINNAKIF